MTRKQATYSDSLGTLSAPVREITASERKDFAKLGGSVVNTWGGKGLTRMASSEDNPDISHFPPRWHSPILSFINFYLPWDVQTLYQWIRYFDTWHPLVGSCVDLHTQLPLSRFGLKGVRDAKILAFYEEVCEEMDAFLVMYDMLREYWLIGECFVYLNWDENIGAFTDAELLMPEYVDIIGHPIMIGGVDSYRYVLIPDESIMAFVESTDPTAMKLREKLPKGVIEAINSPDRRLVIDPFSIMAMIRKQSRYHLRGTSIIMRAFKDLIYESKLQESQFTIADRMIAPKEIWKVGTDTFPANQAKLTALASLIKDAEQQPMFNLVVDHTVSYDIIGAVGKFPNLAQEFDWIESRILTAMFTNKGLTHGEGPNYQNMSVAARALMMRYIPVRAQLEELWKYNVFLPIAIKHGFYEVTPAELAHGIRKPFKDRTPVIPEFDWRYKTNLLDDATYRQDILRLREKGEIPFKTVADAYGWDPEYIEKHLEKEEGTVHDPLYKEYRQALQKGGVKPEKMGSLADFPDAISKLSRRPTRDPDKQYEEKGKKAFESDPGPKQENPLDVGLGDAEFATFGGLKRKKRILQAVQQLSTTFQCTIPDLLTGRVTIPEKYFQAGALEDVPESEIIELVKTREGGKNV